MASPNDPAHVIPQDAYHSWNSARDALSQSIQAYIRASSLLSSSLAHSSSQFLSTHDSPDETSSEFDAQLSCLLDEQKELRVAHAALIISRKKSKTFSAISRLPVEVLSNIFLAASAYPTADDTSKRFALRSPASISQVCHAWRDIALGLPPLWAYLRVIIRRPEIDDASMKRIELWSERSIGADLHLDIWVQNDLGDGELERESYEAYATQVTIHKLIPLLTPLASRIRHLEIGFDLDSTNFLQSLLGCLIGLGASDSIQSLSLWYNHRWNPFGSNADERLDLLPWDPTYLPDNWEDDDSLLDNFLDSVHSLSLRSVNIPRDHEAYHDLTELYLSDVDLSVEEIAPTLESSSGLRILSITDLDLGYGDTPDEPVHLPDLESITLGSGCMGGDDVACVLALLEPGECSLTVDLSLKSVGSSATEDIRSFFSRSYVTNLHLTIAEPNTWFNLLRFSLGRSRIPYFARL